VLCRLIPSRSVSSFISEQVKALPALTLSVRSPFHTVAWIWAFIPAGAPRQSETGKKISEVLYNALSKLTIDRRRIAHADFQEDGAALLLLQKRRL
jgi:hypothetical protein